MAEGRIRSDRVQRLLAICGIIGPVLYTIVLTTLGFLRLGYSHITQSMSELGEAGAPNAIMMNIAGFILLGLQMIGFAFGLHSGISEGRGSRIGPALVAVSGATLVMTGIFTCDPGCRDVSIVGIAHSVFAVIAAFAMILAPLAILPRLKRDSRWRNHQVYSLVTVVAALTLSAVYGFNVFEQWKGALQRVSMGIPLLWIEVMAIRLLRLSFLDKHKISSRSAYSLR